MNTHSRGYGKTYGSAVVNQELGLEDMADQIVARCTVTRSDILAVLSEIGPVLKSMLQQSARVEIPYLGHFKLSMTTVGETQPEKFGPQSIKKARVIFQPLCTLEKINGKNRRVYKQLEGLTFKDIATLQPKKKTTSEGGGDSGDGGDGGRP